jgi:hypothetical protein
LPLVPALGLGVPLALPEQAVVLQEGMGGAVGIVHHLDATGVGHFLKSINQSYTVYIASVLAYKCRD